MNQFKQSICLKRYMIIIGLLIKLIGRYKQIMVIYNNIFKDITVMFFDPLMNIS